MFTIPAVFDGRGFIPQGPENLPAGSKLEISFQSPAAPEKTALEKLLEIAEEFPPNPKSPTDLAENHDHYLYGMPQKS